MFTITNTGGTVTRTCDQHAGKGGCPSTGSW